MSKKYYACVFGGASEKISEHHKKQVKKLGRIITDNGFSLVYGAGATGCMGAIAEGVRDSKGYIMGISPTFMGEFEEVFDCDNTVIVETMAERKTLMEKHADVFIIVPGGMGTLDEFFQVLTLKYLNRLDVPIVIFNHDGFYNSLLCLIDSLVEQNAISKEVYNLFDVIESIDDKKLTDLFTTVKAL